MEFSPSLSRCDVSCCHLMVDGKPTETMARKVRSHRCREDQDAAEESLTHLRWLLSLLGVLSLIPYTTAYRGIPLQNRNWKHYQPANTNDQGRKRHFFHVNHVAPPLPRGVSLAAAVAGLNSTDDSSLAVPYCRHAPDNIDLLSEELPIVYTNNPSTIKKWLANHVSPHGAVIGFDVESVPNVPWVKHQASFRGPATVQLATCDSCLVIHLAHLSGKSSGNCMPVLNTILQDESIVKAGVGIDNDMLELYERFDKIQEAKSRLDLGGIGGMNGRVGLKRLTKSILGVDLKKTKKLVLSDWSQVPLAREQLSYCARDAWAGAAIVAELQKHDLPAFNTETLIKEMRYQRSLHDLYERASRRSKVKNQLKKLIQKNVSSSSSKTQQKCSKTMPMSQRMDMQRLQEIIVDTAPDRLIIFDVEPYGFQIHKN